MFSESVSAVRASVNITIWKGTTMENTHRKYTILLSRLPTREIYHAAMEVHSRIRTVETMVIKKL